MKNVIRPRKKNISPSMVADIGKLLSSIITKSLRNSAIPLFKTSYSYLNAIEAQLDEKIKQAEKYQSQKQTEAQSS